MTEEKLTKTILDWLENNGWTIVCFDFPQSGTGVLLHPNTQLGNSKNKGGFIPDIVATQRGVAVFFENKDRFVLEDYKKTNFLRLSNDYSFSISQLLASEAIQKIFYGIAIPDTLNNRLKDEKYQSLVDFTIMLSTDFYVKIINDPYNIFSDNF